MERTIERILPLWGIEKEHLSQIYSSAWEINHSYVIKMYDNREQLERNITISTILSDYHIPAAKIVLTRKGEKYVGENGFYFLVSQKLQGCNITDPKDKVMARKMGCAMAQLHKAFRECEKALAFWDNSLLQEMQGWVRDTLINNEWQIVDETEYLKAVGALGDVYDHLPRQLIHRDVHFGNFLFFEGNLSGYIDFDLSQRNIRIFDLCYFLTGLLAEETDDAFTEKEWIEIVRSVLDGYESILKLSDIEKKVIPCVMKCIEILFVAYFTGMKDTKHANDAYNVFRFIQNCQSDIVK